MRGRPSVSSVKVPRSRSKPTRRTPGRPKPRDTSISRPGASIGGSGSTRARALTSNLKKRNISIKRNLTSRKSVVKPRTKQIKVRGAYRANIKYDNYRIGYDNPMD